MKHVFFLITMLSFLVIGEDTNAQFVGTSGYGFIQNFKANDIDVLNDGSYIAIGRRYPFAPDVGMALFFTKAPTGAITLTDSLAFPTHTTHPSLPWTVGGDSYNEFVMFGEIHRHSAVFANHGLVRYHNGQIAKVIEMHGLIVGAILKKGNFYYMSFEDEGLQQNYPGTTVFNLSYDTNIGGSSELCGKNGLGSQSFDHYATWKFCMDRTG